LRLERRAGLHHPGRRLPIAGNIDRIDQVRLATRQGLLAAELEPDLDYYKDLLAHALLKVSRASSASA